MKKFKMLLALALIVIMAVGCTPAQNEGGEGGGESDQNVIGFSVSTQNNPFFVTMKDGIDSKAAELGYTVVTVDAQDDTAKQASDIEDLIQQNVAVIIINPTDSDAIASSVEACNAADIPVITVDRSANGGEVVCHIASDNVAGGKMAGEKLLELVGDGADVAELEGIPGSSAARDRGDGFHQAVDGKLNVVGQQPADFDRAKGLSVMENILQANSGIKGVFAHNDEMALGAIEALKAAGRDDVVVIGFDATDDAVKSVQDGNMAATVAQQPELMGQLAIETAQKILAGEQVSDVPVDLQLVTK